jgi:hypothetical protein
MITHTATDPVLDDEGYPLFPFEGCYCPSCMILRAQHDSYKIEKIARVGRLMQKHRMIMATPGVSPEAFQKSVEHFAYLKRGARKALKNWEPALPVTVS